MFPAVQVFCSTLSFGLPLELRVFHLGTGKPNQLDHPFFIPSLSPFFVFVPRFCPHLYPGPYPLVCPRHGSPFILPMKPFCEKKVQCTGCFYIKPYLSINIVPTSWSTSSLLNCFVFQTLVLNTKQLRYQLCLQKDRALQNAQLYS